MEILQYAWVNGRNISFFVKKSFVKGLEVALEHRIESGFGSQSFDRLTVSRKKEQEVKK